MTDFIAQCMGLIHTPEIRQEMKKIMMPIVSTLFEDLLPYIYLIFGIVSLNLLATMSILVYILLSGWGRTGDNTVLHSPSKHL
jgi:hypothetical protein